MKETANQCLPRTVSFVLTTAWNIDWPSSAWISPLAQQREMNDYIDMMGDTNMNAIVFQVRPAGDAFYSSGIEPWSRWLTGTQGTPPSPMWDPLQHCINRAHARNIEVHAWLNPYRASTSNTLDGLAPNNMARQFPQYAHPYGSALWMDPGAEVVIDRLVDVVTDIVTRYDVDGILFDDYFYPYPVANEDFPDDVTYFRYLSSGGHLSRADWRRDNVNRMISRVYIAIHAIKPHVKFGISPFGIYRPGHPTGHPSPPIVGLDQYTALYADALLWQQQGWIDYMAPQLYWAEDPPGQRYSVLLDWWIRLDNNPRRRHVYTANGAYRLTDAQNWPVSELTRQVDISRDDGRRLKLSLGNIFYSAKYFRDNTKGVRDTFRERTYPTPALVPAMSWLGVRSASPPTVRVHSAGAQVMTSDPGSVYRYVLYRAEKSRWVIQQVSASLDSSLRLEKGHYCVTAVDRAWVETEPKFFKI